MRVSPLCFAIALCALLTARAAEVEVTGARKNLPQFRPAVLRRGAESLINRIDAADLLKKGQKDGAIMFCSVVNEKGEATASWTYQGMPGTEALDAELGRKLDRIKYAPAVFNRQYVGVMLFGTLVFSAEGPTHVRIFLNQDPQEIERASDYISPQPVYGADSKFTGLHIEEIQMEVPVSGIVELALAVDATGNLKGLDVLGENPPLLGFGAQTIVDFRPAKFIPAFRSGDPEDTQTRLHVCYKVLPED